MKYCDACPCLSVTEEDQKHRQPHRCQCLGGRQLFHWDQHPNIPRVKDCLRSLLEEEYSITNGTQTIHWGGHGGWLHCWNENCCEAEFDSISEIMIYIRGDSDWRKL